MNEQLLKVRAEIGVLVERRQHRSLSVIDTVRYGHLCDREQELLGAIHGGPLSHRITSN